MIDNGLGGKRLQPPNGFISNQRLARFGIITSKLFYFSAILAGILTISLIMLPVLAMLPLIILVMFWLFMIIFSIFTLGLLWLDQDFTGWMGSVSDWFLSPSYSLESILNIVVEIIQITCIVGLVLGVVSLLFVAISKMRGKTGRIVSIVLLTVLFAIALVIILVLKELAI